MDDHQERKLRAEQMQADFLKWLEERDPLGPGTMTERIFYAGWLAGRRSSPSTQLAQAGGQDASETVGTRMDASSEAGGQVSSPSTQRQGEEEPAEARNAALRAAPAGQHKDKLAALRIIQDLSRISMSLAADLVGDTSYTFQGQDYLDRNSVVDRVMEWRRAWDATSEARKALASRFRAEGGNTSDKSAEVAHPADAPEGGKHA